MTDLPIPLRERCLRCFAPCKQCPLNAEQAATPLREEAEPAPARSLEEMQALRQSVRDKLYGALPTNLASLANYLRVTCLLDEGDELQRQLTEARRALSLEKQRAAGWLTMAGNKPDLATPYLVAAPAPNGSGLITLRRTFLYIGDGVWGLHGRMEHTRADITHFRKLPPPPNELD